MSDLDENMGYYARQQCSTQWFAFLAAFSEEFGQKIPVAELRVLMARLGGGMAKNMPSPEGDTLAELETSINDIWFSMDWGWVRLVEKSDGLLLEHHAAPIQYAFGEEALAWSPAILEGIYAYWFAVIGGKDSPLRLTQVEPAQADSGSVLFRFGRPT